MKKLLCCAFLAMVLLVCNQAYAFETSEVESLYKELLTFKESDALKRMGFSAASPHHEWLKKAQAMSKDEVSERKFLREKGVMVGDLIMLGQAYRSSKGRETDYTKYMSSEFEKAFPQRK